jgi:hypothetical protein
MTSESMMIDGFYSILEKNIYYNCPTLEGLGPKPFCLLSRRLQARVETWVLALVFFFLKKTGKGKGLYVYIHQLGAGGEL